METVSKVGIVKVVLTALLGGLALGVVARSWMRWISTDPEFSWSGTIFIVLAFMIFSTNQSIVLLLRQKIRGKRSVLVVRTFGVIFSLPIFAAAGAIMFPTVALASVGTWNSSLGRRTRGVLLLLSLGIPIKISIDIISDFGWTVATLGRILLFVFIYSLIIIATQPTVKSFHLDGVEK